MLRVTSNSGFEAGRRARLPKPGIFIAVVISAVMSAAPSSAQQACVQLQAQLRALDQSPNPQQLQAEYQQAQQAYEQLYRQADQSGCIPRLFRPEVPASCYQIRVELDQLYNRVAALESQVRGQGGNGGVTRAQILAAIEANGCAVPQAGGGEIFRTVCVRACDGYYFPISYSTRPGDFEEDQAVCQARCPGADLYLHRRSDEPMSTAANLEGGLYQDLENAFLYRTEYRSDCGCVSASTAVADAVSSAAPNDIETMVAALDTGPDVLLPRPRPEPTEDPDTIANRQNGFVPGRLDLGVPAEPSLTDDDGTRLVGPTYYYTD